MNVKRKILIVEDDPKVGLSLKLRLESAGYDVKLASDAPSGANAAIDHLPDLVLLDISLPGGDGFSVAKTIQSRPSPPPIIFLTASERLDFRERARQLGAISFFEKPYDAAVLLGVIREAVAGVQTLAKIRSRTTTAKLVAQKRLRHDRVKKRKPDESVTE